jgi:hypothetical protein
MFLNAFHYRAFHVGIATHLKLNFLDSACLGNVYLKIPCPYQLAPTPEDFENIWGL